MTIPLKLHWLDRAIQVYNYHVSQCKIEKGWNISKTALTLNRSKSSVADDIMLASFSITHEKQLRKFSSVRNAIEFVREKQREMRLREI